MEQILLLGRPKEVHRPEADADDRMGAFVFIFVVDDDDIVDVCQHDDNEDDDIVLLDAAAADGDVIMFVNNKAVALG